MFLSNLLLYYISTHSFKSLFDNRATYLIDIFEQKSSKFKGVINIYAWHHHVLIVNKRGIPITMGLPLTGETHPVRETHPMS